MITMLRQLIEARRDNHYLAEVELLLEDFAQFVGVDRDGNTSWVPLEGYSAQWARYVEEHFHMEYLESWFPTETLALERVDPSVPPLLTSLPMQTDASEVREIRRADFNKKRKLPADITLLHGLSPESTNSSLFGPVGPPGGDA